MRRVVVTGIGLVTPLGIGMKETWDALCAGRSGIAPITLFDSERFDTRFAGEVKNWDATRFMARKKLKEMGRFSQLAMGASVMAWEDSGLEALGTDWLHRVGCIIGVGLGGIDFIEANAKVLFEKGPGRMSPYFIPGCIANLAAGQVAIRLGLRGVNYCTTSACASGAHAIGEAMRWIQRGDAEALIAGGAEAAVSPLGIGGFNAMKALSTRNDSPETASRPFDRDRDGFVVGEGAGSLVLEEREHAMKRGAHIYCEIVGYGASDDAHHITQPHAEGAQRAMTQALADAQLDPERVGYINAHGTSTTAGDINETRAIKAVFGDHTRRLAVSSTKSMMGHLLGAAGGVEAAIIALALQNGVVPPTINLTNPDPECDLDFVPDTAREIKLDVTMSNSFGFGGTNTSLIMARV
ncbi:MAG: beta-ketoacyl-ACP synthase II [Deltaproteobacteria bacterium]